MFYDTITDIDKFKEWLLSSFSKVNINNDKMVEELYDIFKCSQTKDMRGIYDKISAYFKNKRGGRRGSIISIDYWKSLGWEDTSEIKVIISKIQQERSPRNISYYTKRGYSEAEARDKVAKLQGEYSMRGYANRTKDEIRRRSVWSVQHWLDKGYSEEEAVAEMRKRNGACRECYSSDAEYGKKMDLLSQKAKERYNRNPEKFWRERPNFSSKEESDFFNKLSACIYGVKYLHCGVNVQNTILESEYGKQYVLSDGCISLDDGLVLLEYDGDYWHDAEYDLIRDNAIFEVRKDIVGIIRINDKFVRNNSFDVIKKEFEYAIEDIKGKKCKRKLIYES
jgi:hypothetical protein